MAAAFPVNPLDPLAPEQLETLLSKYRPILELKPLKYDEVMVIQQYVNDMTCVVVYLRGIV